MTGAIDRAVCADFGRCSSLARRAAQQRRLSPDSRQPHHCCCTRDTRAIRGTHSRLPQRDVRHAKLRVALTQLSHHRGAITSRRRRVAVNRCKANESSDDSKRAALTPRRAASEHTPSCIARPSPRRIAAQNNKSKQWPRSARRAKGTTRPKNVRRVSATRRSATFQ